MSKDEETLRKITEIRDDAAARYAKVLADAQQNLIMQWEGPQQRQLTELLEALRADTVEPDDVTIILRALAIYRSFVAHAKSGGKVVYQPADGSTQKPRTLKVHLR